MSVIRKREDSICRRREDSVWAAPPLESMNLVLGYENTNYDVSTVVPPPQREVVLPTISEFKKNTPNLNIFALTLEPLLNQGRNLHISEDDARNALEMHVKNHCCYGNKAVREMTLSKSLYSSTFHYKLETFTEKRQIAWAFEPNSGDACEASSSEAPPQPWEVEVPPPPAFTNQVTQVEIPRTASIKVCHTCSGSGKLVDLTCHGQGQSQCTHCHGDGHYVELSGHRKHCNFCQGRGIEKCYKCSGVGYYVCKTCSGKGHLKCFIRLTVTWTNHVDEHVSEKTDLPSKLVKRVSGHLVLDDQQASVCPITHFPDITVTTASEQLIRHHANILKDERVIQQRHQVRLVPVNEVHYKWRGRPYKFWVYGYEKELYVPDYPQTCCWGVFDCVLS